MKLIPTLQLSVRHLFTTDHMKLMCTVDGSGWFHATLRLKSLDWLKLRKVDADGMAIPFIYALPRTRGKRSKRKINSLT
jgi:hypothetical protein